MNRDGARKNILIIKPGAIGDLLQLTPVVRALASARPDARITLLVGTKATATLFRHHPLVSETLVYDRRGEHRSFLPFFRLWRHIRKGGYSLVVNFQRSNLKTWLLASAAFPCRVLVYHKSRRPDVHAVDDYLRTLAPLGVTGQDRSLELYPGRTDEEFAAGLFSRSGFDNAIVIALNPGASHPVNRWGAAKFSALADMLAESLSAKVILIGGGEDLPLAEEIASAAASKPQVLCGKTTLLQTAAVLKKCDLLVSGDTGPLHLATAVGTRVLALFGAAAPERTGPVGPGHRVIRATGVMCVPCRSRACRNSRYLECMESISVREVAAAAAEMASERTKRPV